MPDSAVTLRRKAEEAVSKLDAPQGVNMVMDWFIEVIYRAMLMPFGYSLCWRRARMRLSAREILAMRITALQTESPS